MKSKFRFVPLVLPLALSASLVQGCKPPENDVIAIPGGSCSNSPESGSGLELVDVSTGDPSAGAALYPNEELGRLTQGLRRSHERYLHSSGADRDRLEQELHRQVRERSRLVMDWLEREPGLLFQNELTLTERSKLPRDAQACAEQRVEVEGTLEVLAFRRSKPSKDRPEEEIVYLLKTSSGKRYALRFAQEPPAALSGEQVKVKGITLPCESAGEDVPAQPLLVKSGSTDFQQLAAIAARTFGAQSTAVILINFQDKSGTYTQSQVQSVVFTQVSDFLRENSSGQTWLKGQGFGPYTVSLASTGCSSSQIASAAKSAAQAAGADLSQFSRFVYVFPKNGCSWLGLGTIGGNPSESWINASFTLHTVAHEMGHNLGLYHSNAQSCGTSSPIGTSCSTIEYGDTTDVMGKVAGHYNAFQKERLGWLGYGSSPAITQALGSGVFELDPFSVTGTRPKALKLLKSTNVTTGAKTYYYLEYRQPMGFDSVFSRITSNNLARGIVVHTGSTATGNSSQLLNMNPANTSWYQAALNPGQSFEDPTAGVGFRLRDATSGGATLEVNIPSSEPVCVRNAPRLELSPSQGPWVTAGTTLVYGLTLTNQDTEGCEASTFTLGSRTDAPLSLSLSQNSFALSPGSSQSLNLEVTSEIGPDSPPGSTHLFELTGTHGADTNLRGVASGTYLIAPDEGMRVAINPQRTLYMPGENVALNISIVDAGLAAVGFPFSLKIRVPDGSVVERAGITGESGTALYALKLSSCAHRGVYTVEVQAAEGDRSATASASFEVL